MSEIAKLAALLRATVTAINNGRRVSDEAADNLERQEAEIDRLCAKLAFMRGHGIVQDNERLRAELAQVREILGDREHELALLGDKCSTAIWSRDHERADNEKLRAELAEAKTRIAELEKRFATQLVRTVDANARAEAERDALRRQMSDVGDRLECAIKDVGKRQYHIEVAITRVRAALNPSPVGEKT